MSDLLRRMAARVLLATLVAAASAVSYTSAALAQEGDAGDIKVHDSTTPANDQRNDPKVCEFYLVGFNFDAGQVVTWTIAEQPPTGTEQMLDGALVLDQNGFGRTDDMSLPDGHYKVTWNFVGEQGAGKFKVFTVDCEDQTPTPTPTTPAKTTAPGVPTEFPAGYANASDAQPFPLGAVIGLSGLALFLAGLATLIGTARRRGRHEV